MKQTQFSKILDEKLSKLSQTSTSNQTEIGIDPANLSYLMGKIPKYTFNKNSPRQAYGQNPQKISQPEAPHYLSVAQIEDWKCFASHGAPLRTGYKKGDLKVAFRKIAKKIHPDILQTPESHELFLRLQMAFKGLYCMGR